VASADWIGWIDLKREAVNEVATRNIAAVIRDVDPDILVVVEAEDRPALQRFNQEVLRLDPDASWGSNSRCGRPSPRVGAPHT